MTVISIDLVQRTNTTLLTKQNGLSEDRRHPQTAPTTSPIRSAIKATVEAHSRMRNLACTAAPPYSMAGSLPASDVDVVDVDEVDASPTDGDETDGRDDG